MKKGFTLAEVLITLGIIGVVAAMTIPTLIQNTNSVKFASQFKKSISTLSQAALMSQAQYDIDYSLVTLKSSASPGREEGATTGGRGCGAHTVAGGDYSICGIFNNTLAGQTYYGAYGSNDVKAANGSEAYEIKDMGNNTLNPTGMYVYSLADGSYVGFNPNAVKCGLGAGNVLNAAALQAEPLKDCMGFIDVNGPTPPNKVVTCNTEGDTKLDPSDSCDVARTGASMGDVFPIVFHDGTVEPASNAAKMVLTRGK